ncbi:probable beta-glucosidase I [Solanum dulcamara]|uniref:probable beta-glucosidase I n=1 Tax=Solanum dulcamara TaxID=45834 RepID=UPI0024857960|nr:probable beta-glucosidase I [Solanum dulcamara]
MPKNKKTNNLNLKTFVDDTVGLIDGADVTFSHCYRKADKATDFLAKMIYRSAVHVKIKATFEFILEIMLDDGQKLYKGLAMYRLTTPTACAMLGLVHTMENSKLPTADVYGTTILNAVKNTVHPSTQVVDQDNPVVNFVKSNHFSYAIVVVGEIPYAGMSGDSANLTIAEPGPSIISNVCGVVKCVVVVISGRPVVMEPYLSNIDTLVAAWLPRSEGQGVADVLFGDYGLTSKLMRTWFKSVDKLHMNVGDPHYDPLFPFGFGLTTEPLELKFTNGPETTLLTYSPEMANNFPFSQQPQIPSITLTTAPLSPVVVGASSAR